MELHIIKSGAAAFPILWGIWGVVALNTKPGPSSLDNLACR